MDTPATKERNALSYLFGMTWRYSEGNRKAVTLYWVLFFIGNAVGLFCGPLLWARFMNTVQAEGITHESLPALFGLLGMSILLEFFFWLMHGPARLIERDNAFKARARYRAYLLQGVMTLGLDWHAEHHSGDTIDRVEKGTASLFEFSSESFEIISAAVRLLVSCAMLVWFSPVSILIVAVMVAATIVMTVRFDRILMPQYRALNRAEHKVAESVFDTVSNITTVVILRIERQVYETIRRKIQEPYALFARNNRVNEAKWFLTSLCGTVMAAAVMGAYCWMHLGSPQGVLVGNLYLLFRYLGEISELLFRFTGSYGTVIKQKARVLNAEELAEDFVPRSFANHVLPKDWREVQVRGLSFSYGNGAEAPLHLDDLGFSLVRGERIALVGRSGSGKSTFLKLLRDLYHPRSLALSVDGRPVEGGFEGISRAISLIPQDPEIFATTILENVTLGADYPPEEVRHYAEMACFEDVVASLPKGYGSSVKEKGVSLSGGERQRLALARGLLASRDKSIVLLDEPTSSVDAENERRIYRNVFDEFRDKTVVSSIHRLNLLPLFDRVFFFEKGRMAVGTVESLIAGNAGFRNLWERHARHAPAARR